MPQAIKAEESPAVDIVVAVLAAWETFNKVTAVPALSITFLELASIIYAVNEASTSSQSEGLVIVILKDIVNVAHF